MKGENTRVEKVTVKETMPPPKPIRVLAIIKGVALCR